MTYVFKCRQCGELDRSLHRGGNADESHMVSVVDLCNAINDTVEDQAPKMLTIHCCGKNRTGIADLVGCEPDKE